MNIIKIIKALPAGYIDDAASFDEQKMRDEIVKADATIAEVERAMEQDDKLNGARDIVKDLAGGYNDVKKAQRAKVAYLLHLLDERGKPVQTGAAG